MPEYTWDDWKHMLEFLRSDFNPKAPFAYESPDTMLRYFMECKYAHLGKVPYNRALYVLFEMPFDDLPLVLNEEIKLGLNQGTLMINMIAEWRLLVGK